MDLKEYTLSLIEKYGIKPDFLSDQHFMVDESLIRKIVKSAGIRKKETILEIGPGLGSLTKELAMKSAKKSRVIAIEVDKRFERVLVKEVPNTRIIMKNALEKIDKIRFDKIVSNIPYAICEPLLHKLARVAFKKAVLAVPKSFAVSLAEEKTKLYFFAQSFFETRILFDIPRESFYPEPKTESVAISLEPRRDYKKDKVFFILRKLFEYNQKKLRNSLMEALIISNKLTKRTSKQLIRTFGLDESMLEKGADQLSFEELRYLKEKLTLEIRRD